MAPRGRPKELTPDVRVESGKAQGPAPTTMGLSEVIGRFKKGVIDGLWRPYERMLWQRGYYDHIVRDAADLAAIRRYIRDNPLALAPNRHRDVCLKIDNSRTCLILGMNIATVDI